MFRIRASSEANGLQLHRLRRRLGIIPNRLAMAPSLTTSNTSRLAICLVSRKALRRGEVSVTISNRLFHLAWPIISTIVPDDIKFHLRHARVKREFINYTRKTFGAHYSQHSPGPVAPAELITTEALMSERDLPVKARPDWYFSTGYGAALEILTASQNAAHSLTFTASERH